MSFGRLEKPSGNRPMSDINVTPLVDVMLVLLVIFIIASPLMSSRLQIELPGMGPLVESVQEGEDASVTVGLSAQGELFWGDEPVTAEQLQARLRAAAQRDAQTEMQLRADAQVSYGQVARVMAMAQQAGLVRLGLVGDPQSGELTGPADAPGGSAVR